MPSELARLRAENARLRSICRDLQPCARRYADGRMTYVPGMVNDATRYLLSIGVQVNPCGERIIWARDGMGRPYDGLTAAQATPGTPEAVGGVAPAAPQRAPDLVLCYATEGATAVARMAANLDVSGRIVEFGITGLPDAAPADVATAAYRVGLGSEEVRDA